MVAEFLRRALRPGLMDFERAVFDFVYICLQPKKVYHSVSVRKQTKGQWARDDPAFVILLVFMLTVASLAYAIAFNDGGFLQILRLVFYSVFVDFILWGAFMATAMWFVCNKFLRASSISHGADPKVEWRYAYDVHCNAFVATYLLLYVGQYLLLPIFFADGIISRILANTLYLVSFTTYYYLTYLGFQALPFLENTEKLLLPIGIGVLFYLIALTAGVNFAQLVLNFYFSP